MKSALAGKAISLEKISGEYIAQLRRRLILKKKKTLMAHLFLYRLLHREIPSYNQALVRPGIGDYLSAISLHMRIFISKRKILKKLFPILRQIFKTDSISLQRFKKLG